MAQTEPPAPGSYSFVLATIRAYDPSQERLATTYGESHQSRNILHPDGRRRPTVFFSDPNGVSRLQKMGWEDVSAPWFAAHPETHPDAVAEAAAKAAAAEAETAKIASAISEDEAAEEAEIKAEIAKRKAAKKRKPAEG